MLFVTVMARSQVWRTGLEDDMKTALVRHVGLSGRFWIASIADRSQQRYGRCDINGHLIDSSRKSLNVGMDGFYSHDEGCLLVVVDIIESVCSHGMLSLSFRQSILSLWLTIY